MKKPETESNDEKVHMRIYPIAGRPDHVIKAVELGFDLFAGSYPLVVTNNNQAMAFDYTLDEEDKKSADDNGVQSQNEHSNESEHEESRPKRIKIEQKPILLDLKDKK